MSTADFLLEVVTPHALLYSGRATEMTAPGGRGYFGVLPGHRPFLAALDVGELTCRGASGVARIAVSKGFVEVLGDRVTVLADSAERPSEIDVARARRAQERAEARLRAALAGDSRVDVFRAELALRRALTRLGVASRGG